MAERTLALRGKLEPGCKQIVKNYHKMRIAILANVSIPLQSDNNAYRDIPLIDIRSLGPEFALDIGL